MVVRALASPAAVGPVERWGGGRRGFEDAKEAGELGCAFMWWSRAPSLQSRMHSYTYTDTYGRGVCMFICSNSLFLHTLLSSGTVTGGLGTRWVHLHLLTVAN
jgi:hypothetical protein